MKRRQIIELFTNLGIDFNPFLNDAKFCIVKDSFTGDVYNEIRYTISDVANYIDIQLHLKNSKNS